MKRVYLFILLVSLVTLPAAGQSAGTAGKPAYSESIGYQPRTFADLEKKKKKQKAAKTAEPSKPVPAMSPNTSFPLYVSVMNAGGQLVTDLKQSDFSVYIDDTEAAVEAFRIDEEPVSVLLVVDTSPSATTDLKELKAHALSTIEQFRPGDPVTVISFNSELRVLNEPTTDRAVLRKSVDRLRLGDGTSLYEAVRTIFASPRFRVPGPKAVVILTDGVDTTSRKADYISSLEAAERADTPVFPLYLDTFPTAIANTRGIAGLGNPMILFPPGYMSKEVMAESYERGRLYLNDLVYLSGGRGADLSKPPLATTISDQLRRRYLLNITRTGEASIGQRRRIRVRVNRPGLAVIARGSYIAE